jgi:hypothetical protein
MAVLVEGISVIACRDRLDELFPGGRDCNRGRDVYEYDVNSATGDLLNGLYIEVQYRTLIQHT